MRPYRIGFLGNSCTGKTTSLFAAVTTLKLLNLRVGYVTDRCRFVTFDPERFDDSPETRLHIIGSQLAAEMEQMVRPDIDYLVVERTILDWMLYYRWTCDRIKLKLEYRQAIKLPDYRVIDFCWAMGNYDLMFGMVAEGMQYVDDGYRPKSIEQHDEMESYYAELFRRLNREHYPIHFVHGDNLNLRSHIVTDVMRTWLKEHPPRSEQ